MVWSRIHDNNLEYVELLFHVVRVFCNIKNDIDCWKFVALNHTINVIA